MRWCAIASRILGHTKMLTQRTKEHGMLQYSNAVRVRTMASTKCLADGNERVAKIADFGQRSANLR